MIRFLLDENMPSAIISALQQLDSNIDIMHIGQQGAPPIGTLDPAILLFCEQEGRVLVTNNRHSMPKHIEDHFHAGHHHAGIIEVNKPIDIGKVADDLHLYWVLETTESLSDGMFYL